MSRLPPPPSGATPAQRMRAAARSVGAAELARRCGEVLSTGEVADDLLLVIGGSRAGLVHEEHRVDQAYWIPTWALRAFLYVWDEEVAPEVVRALGHPHWRVREMAAKVAATREVGAAADALADHGADAVPRVRAAVTRGLAVVGEAEHADIVRALQHDPDDRVRDRADEAMDAMTERLDRDI